MRKIYYCGGDKGGVGKSMLAVALIDYLRQKKESVVLVETDTANPDVAKVFKGVGLEYAAINLDIRDGWIDLVNWIDSRKEMNVVINSGARSGVGFRSHGKILLGSLGELGAEFVSLWIINRQRDSVEALREHVRVVGLGKNIVVLRNLYFGEEGKFDLFNGSKIKGEIEEAEGLVLNYPDLADRVAEVIMSERRPIEELVNSLPLGNRAELIRWRNEVGSIMEKICGR